MIVTKLESSGGVRVVRDDETVSTSELLFSELVLFHCVVRLSMLGQVLQESVVVVLYEE